MTVCRDCGLVSSTVFINVPGFVYSGLRLCIPCFDKRYEAWIARHKEKGTFKPEWETNPQLRRKMFSRYVGAILRDTSNRATGVIYSKRQWDALVSHYCPDGVCLCCGERKNLVADHVVSVYERGSNSIDNMQPLCGKCNRAKGASTRDYRPDGGAYARHIAETIEAVRPGRRGRVPGVKTGPHKNKRLNKGMEE